MGGKLLLSGSLLSFSTLGVDSTFWEIVPGLILGGFGMSLAMTPTTAAAMGSVPVDKAGVGSAVLNSMRQVGIALMGAIVAASVSVLPTSPDYPDQFVEGYHNALHVAAAIAILGAVVAVATVRKVAHPEPEAPPALEGA